MPSHVKTSAEHRRQSAFSLCIPGGDTSVSFHDFFNDDEIEHPSTSRAALDVIQKDYGVELSIDTSQYCTCIAGGSSCGFLAGGGFQMCPTFEWGPLHLSLSKLRSKIPCRRRGAQRETRNLDRFSATRGRNIAKTSSNTKSWMSRFHVSETLIFSLTSQHKSRPNKWQAAPHRVLARSRSLSGGSPSKIPLSTALNTMEKVTEHDDDLVFSDPGGPVTKRLSLQNLSINDESPAYSGHVEGAFSIVANYEDDLCTRLNGLHSPNYEDVILGETVSSLEAEMESCTISPF